MQILSPAFKNNSAIPSRYTCDGGNYNPPLEFAAVPTETKTLVLIMEDPDVPKNLRSDGMWDHWLVWNLPPQTRLLPERSKPPGVIGLNTNGRNDYAGPCPPDRQHRYFFKLYALDTQLDLPPTSNKTVLLAAMHGHIIEQAELIGLYKRK